MGPGSRGGSSSSPGQEWSQTHSCYPWTLCAPSPCSLFPMPSLLHAPPPCAPPVLLPYPVSPLPSFSPAFFLALCTLFPHTPVLLHAPLPAAWAALFPYIGMAAACLAHTRILKWGVFPHAEWGGNPILDLSKYSNFFQWALDITHHNSKWLKAMFMSPKLFLIQYIQLLLVARTYL